MYSLVLLFVSPVVSPLPAPLFEELRDYAQKSACKMAAIKECLPARLPPVSSVSLYCEQPAPRSSLKEAVCMCNAVTLLLMHEAPCLLLVKTLPLKSICSGSTEFNISLILIIRAGYWNSILLEHQPIGLNNLEKISNCYISHHYCKSIFVLSHERQHYPLFFWHQLVMAVMSQHIDVWLLLIGLTHLQAFHNLHVIRLNSPI